MPITWNTFGASFCEFYMTEYTDSTDRKGVEYVLFALGFFAFVLGLVGVVVEVPAVAVAGGFLLLVVSVAFGLRSGDSSR